VYAGINVTIRGDDDSFVLFAESNEEDNDYGGFKVNISIISRVKFDCNNTIGTGGVIYGHWSVMQQKLSSDIYCGSVVYTVGSAVVKFNDKLIAKLKDNAVIYIVEIE